VLCILYQLHSNRKTRVSGNIFQHSTVAIRRPMY